MGVELVQAVGNTEDDAVFDSYVSILVNLEVVFFLRKEDVCFIYVFHNK